MSSPIMTAVGSFETGLEFADWDCDMSLYPAGRNIAQVIKETFDPVATSVLELGDIASLTIKCTEDYADTFGEDYVPPW